MPTDPRPRDGILPADAAMDWPNALEVKFDLVNLSINDARLRDVMKSRRSTRHIELATTMEVANVVRETMRAHFIGIASKEGRKLKAVISAGALHPVKAFIIGPGEQPLYYDDAADRFLSLPVEDPLRLKDFLTSCAMVLPEAHGHLIALIGDTRDLASHYSNHLSLLWRDSGAVIQMMALVAEANALAFCPLGILGHDLIEALRSDALGLTALGVMAIGRSTPR